MKRNFYFGRIGHYLFTFLLTLFCTTGLWAQTDVSGSIVNAGFDGQGFGGWRNFGFQTQTNTSFTLKTYHAYAEKWVTAGTRLPDSYLLQTITGLTNGQYTLTANAQNINQNATSTSQTGAYLVANEHQTTVTAANTYSVTFYVVDGTAEIGFILENCSGNWVAIDNFTLSRVNTNVSSLRTGLSALITKANTLVSQNMDATVKSTLNSAISTASSLTSSGTATNVSNAYSNLKAAIKNAENSIYAYGKSTSGGPTVVTDTRYQVGTNIAFARSTVTGSNITAQGFVYSSSNATPTLADDRTTRYLDHVGYIHILDNLTPGTTYYIRAYAVNSSNRVGYGDVLRIYTLPRSTKLTYNLNGADDEFNARINSTMQSLMGYWNACTSIVGFTPTANYGSGTPTADCSYGGWIRFGPNVSYQATGTAMHECLHGIGVGTDVTYSEHMEVYSSGPGNSYGQWRGKRSRDLTRFWDNNETEWVTGGGSHVWATNGTNMTSYTINGAQEDAHNDLQYYANGLLAQAMSEDGMCPVANKSFLPGYCFTHTDNTKYYIRNSNESYGANTSTYLYASGTTLKWKTYASDAAAQADAAAAWYIEFDPATQYYYFKNVSTSRYLYTGDGNFAVSGSSKTSTTAVHLHLGWWEASFGASSTPVTKDTYYLMFPASTAYPKSLTATASGNVTSANYSAYEPATASRWMILTASEMGDIADALIDEQRENVLDIIELVRKMARTTHTDNTGTANSTLASTLSTIESAVPSASNSQLVQCYDDVIAACKTFMANTTPNSAGYDITFLLANAGMDGTDGWSGTAPTNNYSSNEFFQKTFNFYQTLSDMPSGSYRMKMQAYERPGSAADVYSAYMSGTDAVTAQIYLGSASQSINNIGADAVTTKYGVGAESEVTYNDATAYFPNDMQSGAYYFSKLLYDNAVDNENFAGGSLTLGIRNTSSVNFDWTMFDNVRLYYYGGQGGGEVTSPLDGWAKLTALPSDFNPYFFVLADHTQDLGLVQKTGSHQGANNKAAWYAAGVDPGSDKTFLWTFDSNIADNTEYVVMANATYPDYMMQTEWNAAWHFRTNDNGGGDIGWGHTLISYADSKWTVQNGHYPEAGYLGPWDNTILDGAETALNKTDSNVGYFDIYSMLRGEYVARYEMLEAATIDQPIDISYVLGNPGGERRSAIGWKAEGTGWQAQISSALTGKVGGYFLERWVANGLGESQIYQEIQGLPDGRYKFSAIAHCSSNCSLFANDVTTAMPTNNPGTRTEVLITLSGGSNTLRVGARSASNAGSWIAFDDARLEYLGVPETYYVGDPVISITDGSYIQDLQTVTFNYHLATSTDATPLTLLSSTAQATVKKGNTTVAQGTLSLSGTVLTATFTGLTLDTASDYTLTLPADVVGYSGQVANDAVTLTLHTPVLFDTTCYLLNNATQQYLSRGGRWNTQAIADDYGLAVQIVTDAEGHTRLRCFDNQLYLYDDGTTLFADGGNGIILQPESVNGSYRFQNLSGSGFLAIDGDVVTATGNITATTVLWTLEPTADHPARYAALADAQAATAATAAGLTDVTTLAQLEAHNFLTDEIAVTGAREEKFQQYAPIVEAGDDLDYYTETLDHLTPGLYRLSVDAFQRAAYNDWVAAADGARGLIFLYANDAQTQLKSVMEYGATTAYTSDYTYGGLHYPNDETSAYAALETGNYQNVVYVNVPADGTLTFGIRIHNRMGNGVATGTWAVYENFRLEHLMPLVVLDETATTAPAAATNVAVRLLRTLVGKDNATSGNAWNTICFPFDMTADQITATFGEGTVVKSLDSVTKNGESANLTFAPVTEIVANTPYIMQLATAPTTNEYILRGVNVMPTDEPTVTVGDIQFVGNYVKDHVMANNGGEDYYLLNDVFKHSTGRTKIKGYRAYFHVPATSGIKSLGFDPATGIDEVQNTEDEESTTVYDLSGRRVARPSKGMYIVNGKKVFVK